MLGTHHELNRLKLIDAVNDDEMWSEDTHEVFSASHIPNPVLERDQVVV